MVKSDTDEQDTGLESQTQSVDFLVRPLAFFTMFLRSTSKPPFLYSKTKHSQRHSSQNDDGSGFNSIGTYSLVAFCGQSIVNIVGPLCTLLISNNFISHMQD